MRERRLATDLHIREAVELRRLGERAVECAQRAHRVDRRPLGVGGPEDVVEHLERERAGVAGREHVGDEGVEVEAALARKATVVAAPLQQAHVEPRRIGELDEEELVEPARPIAAREHVEGVDARADGGMARSLDDPQGVLVRVDVPAPGERLVRDPDAAAGRALRQFAQLLGDERVVVDRVLAHARAHEQQVGAELLHQRELRLGAGEVRLRHGLEVAQRLVEVEREAEIGEQRAHGGGGERRGDQVGLEQLDAVEAGGGRRAQLLLQRAAEAHGGDRAPHAVSSAKWRSIRSRSGRTPVNSSNESAAWKTTMPPPCSVRQPHSRAARSSAVSSGR